MGHKGAEERQLNDDQGRPLGLATPSRIVHLASLLLELSITIRANRLMISG